MQMSRMSYERGDTLPSLSSMPTLEVALSSQQRLPCITLATDLRESLDAFILLPRPQRGGAMLSTLGPCSRPTSSLETSHRFGLHTSFAAVSASIAAVAAGPVPITTTRRVSCRTGSRAAAKPIVNKEKGGMILGKVTGSVGRVIPERWRRERGEAIRNSSRTEREEHRAASLQRLFVRNRGWVRAVLFVCRSSWLRK